MSYCSSFLFAAALAIAPALYAYQGAAPAAGSASATKAQSPQAVTSAPSSSSQTPAAVTPIVPIDPILTEAENLVGRALFLRGFYASNSLSYDSSGKVLASSNPTDWTLAAVNVLKATRPSPDSVELDGIRAAIRYNPDAHEFQRHPLNDEKVKLVIQVSPNSDAAAHQLLTAFDAIFSIGIDPALQRSMPPLWRHYFDSALPWPADTLSNETIYPMPPLPALPGAPVEIIPPILSHQTSSQFTAAARHDRVQGPVQLRVAVDAQGVPQRIAVTRPLGYGLDQQAAEAVAKWRFNPALHGGVSVASVILINIDFEIPPPPH